MGWNEEYRAVGSLLANEKQIVLPPFSPLPDELLPVFDDSENFYRVIKHDHIAYRFEVLSVLGKGSFGQVVLAMDHMNGKQVAIKIIRTEARFTRQVSGSLLQKRKFLSSCE